ncbi:MAG TPA: hypothetical protein VE959_20860 [Bryobacteraceae bacterium]|nr:hypothetical protein [Bryobacteraceae bacterium]
MAGRITLLGLAVSACLPANDGDRPSSVLLQDCTELIAFGPVSQAKAAPLVPHAYTITSFGPGTAGLVVRGCQVTGDGSPSRPTSVAQTGIAIQSPDGSGSFNNYQFLGATDNDALADALSRAGVPALLDREMAYEFTVDTTGHSGQLYVAVSPPGLPAWFESGTWSDPPPNSAAPVVANSTSIGSISYGPAAITVYTSQLSLLGTLFGGNVGNNFPFFNARGVFGEGQLDIVLN